ncbi:MAG: extracellular solute-binding protein [Spirochaetes bacterium]|nr:extracellular solute-binding protein [Spirochaetota bacterium]
MKIYLIFILFLIFSCSNDEIKFLSISNDPVYEEYLQKVITSGENGKNIVYKYSENYKEAYNYNFDFVRLPSQFLKSLSDNDKIVSLNEHFSFDFFSGFMPNAIQSVTENDKIFGIPDTIGDNRVVFYNKSLLNKFPANTDELFQLIKISKDKEVFNFDRYDPENYIIWLYAFTGNKSRCIDFTNFRGEIVNSLDFYQKLVDETDYYSYSELRSRFSTGLIHSIIDNEASYSYYKAKLGENLGVAPPPILSKNGIRAVGRSITYCYAIKKGLNEKKLSRIKNIIERLSSDEIHRNMINYNKYSVKSALSTGDATSDSNLAVIRSTLEESIPRPDFEYLKNFAGTLKIKLKELLKNEKSSITIYDELSKESANF